MQVIAVHGGAGYHSKQSEKAVKHVLRRYGGLSTNARRVTQPIRPSVSAVRARRPSLVSRKISKTTGSQ